MECFEHGAAGVEEDLLFSQDSLEYEPKLIHSESHAVKVYFTEKPSETLLLSLQSRYASSEFRLTQVLNKDWMAEWKKSYKPFELTDNVWVVPSWCDVPPTCERSIRIDPGMAFGTGTHATTQACARILATRLKTLECSQISLVDVGTGTGILVILARLFGIKKLLATDIDPQACLVANENLVLNGIKDVMVTSADISKVEESFDVVVANIVDGVLIKLKEHLLRLLKPQGSLILSGILKEREEIFETQFIGVGSFVVVQKLESDEWLAYELRRS